MMLQALLHYAERKMVEDQSFSDPDFEPVDLHWLIQIDEAGKLSGDPLSLITIEGKKKKVKKSRRPATSVNELSVRSLEKAKSYFLCDSLERVILLFDEGIESVDPLAHARQRYFKSLLTEASNDAPNVTSAMLAFLNSQEELAHCREKLNEARADSGHNCTFQVAGGNVLDDQRLIQFWRKRRSASQSSKGEKQICLVTGILSETISTTEKIKGVGAQDTNLISANEKAFQSYGLDQSKNSPISARAEQLTRAALNELIKKAFRTGDKSPIYHLSWTKEPAPTDLFALLTSADDAEVKNFQTAPKNGMAPAKIEANAYYAMSLSGNGGRIIIRDWLESTVQDIETNIHGWFEDLEIIETDGANTKYAFKVWSLLAALVPKKDGKPDFDKLPPQVATQFLYAALRGTALPQTALTAAIRRQQIENKQPGDHADPRLNPARMALIRAGLNRSLSTITPKIIMTASLDSDSSDAAYLCGRLFAVFDRLQYLALGGVNAGVVERFYASASVTPALVMGRLFRNAQFHLAKAGGGIAENARKDFEEISSALGKTFPASLDLEAQGRFALGYYHQKADYRRRTAERKEAKEAAEATTT